MTAAPSSISVKTDHDVDVLLKRSKLAQKQPADISPKEYCLLQECSLCHGVNWQPSWCCDARRASEPWALQPRGRWRGRCHAPPTAHGYRQTQAGRIEAVRMPRGLLHQDDAARFALRTPSKDQDRVSARWLTKSSYRFSPVLSNPSTA